MVNLAASGAKKITYSVTLGSRAIDKIHSIKTKLYVPIRMANSKVPSQKIIDQLPL
jgi:hypothetical protein